MGFDTGILSQKKSGDESMYRKELIESGLFVNMDTDEIEAVLAVSKPEVRTFKYRETLWEEGSVVGGIGVMLSGKLLCRRLQPDGKTQLLRLFEPPNLMNLEAAVSRKRTNPVSVIANTDGQYLWFVWESLFENAALPHTTVHTLQRNLLACIADDGIRFMNKTGVLARRTVRGRIFLFLSLLRSRQGDYVNVGMSQEEFAQYLCVDRSSLSLELNNMRRDGLIEFEGTKYRLKFPTSSKGSELPPLDRPRNEARKRRDSKSDSGKPKRPQQHGHHVAGP
jgi:CRP-like cAMP-binding protein